MSTILGLHFGHDASICLIRDEGIVGFWEKERHSRVKHAIGLTAEDITRALQAFGVGLSSIDSCAISSTQGLPIFMFDDQLSIELDPDGGLPMDRDFAQTGPPFPIPFLDQLRRLEPQNQYFDFMSWSHRPVLRELLVDDDKFASFSSKTVNAWTLEQIAAVEILDIALITHQVCSVRVFLDGHLLKGMYVSHHYAHACYAHFESPYERSLVITADGLTGRTFAGGGIYFGYGDKILPVIPHHFWQGTFYDRVAERIGLGNTLGRSGKLMGLAAWGRPTYFSETMVGNWIDLPSNYTVRLKSPDGVADYWVRTIKEAHGLPEKCDLTLSSPVEPLLADIASSAQFIFERGMLKTTEAALEITRRVKIPIDGIVYSGGCALNCPANSLAYNYFDKPVFVPPAVNDEGISIGAALAARIIKGEKLPQRSRSAAEIAFRGSRYADADVRAAIEKHAHEVERVPGDNSEAFLAKELSLGRVIGIFEGAAEIGPRALGHRSIIASPLLADNWLKVNKIKNREFWRPLAPVVDKEAFHTYFAGCPEDTPFMLFNARVKTLNLPAVTHKDGSARVQVINAETGFIHRLVKAFAAITGVPVLLNTSFNDRGEPIVETPEDALKCFLRIGLDYLWIQGELIKPLAKTDRVS